MVITLKCIQNRKRSRDKFIYLYTYIYELCLPVSIYAYINNYRVKSSCFQRNFEARMMQREIYAGCIYPLSSALYISCMGHINYTCSFCNMMRRVLHYVVLNVRWLLVYFIVPFKSLKCDRKIIIRNLIDILKISYDLKYIAINIIYVKNSSKIDRIIYVFIFTFTIMVCTHIFRADV